jgi:hypothetical protein
VERDLTVDEALQMQTYQAALKGKCMAIRRVLKMIEKRETALGVSAPAQQQIKLGREYDSDSANEAMLLLCIADYGPPTAGGGPATRRLMLSRWAAQAAISRPGRTSLTDKQTDTLKRDVIDFDKLKWPRRRTR